MTLDVHQTLSTIKSKIGNMRFPVADRNKQRSTIGYISPILFKAEKPSYELQPEKNIRIYDFKKALEDFLDGYVFSILPVTTDGIRKSPDWANSKMLGNTIFSAVFGQTKQNQVFENLQCILGTLSTNQKNELQVIKRILRDEVSRELALKLSNDVGNFSWTKIDGQQTFGTLAICRLSLFPILFYFCAAVKAADWNEADRALALINQMRFALPIGDKAVSPGSWYLLTAPDN